jgi:hypothetical protein
MKAAYFTSLLACLALPALAQDAGPVTFSCNYPFGDHSLGVLATNSGPDTKTCRATCVAHDSKDDTGLLFFSTTCEGDVPAGAVNLQMCSRGDYQGDALENARVVTEVTRCQ